MLSFIKQDYFETISLLQAVTSASDSMVLVEVDIGSSSSADKFGGWAPRIDGFMRSDMARGSRCFWSFASLYTRLLQQNYHEVVK